MCIYAHVCLHVYIHTTRPLNLAPGVLCDFPAPERQSKELEKLERFVPRLRGRAVQAMGKAPKSQWRQVLLGSYGFRSAMSESRAVKCFKRASPHFRANQASLGLREALRAAACLGESSADFRLTQKLGRNPTGGPAV